MPESLRAAIRDVVDFPQPGIVFKDITPILADGKLFGKSISLLCDIAMRLGRKVKWDPVTETCPGDDAANRLLSRTMRGPWQV